MRRFSWTPLTILAIKTRYQQKRWTHYLQKPVELYKLAVSKIRGSDCKTIIFLVSVSTDQNCSNNAIALVLHWCKTATGGQLDCAVSHCDGGAYGSVQFNRTRNQDGFYWESWMQQSPVLSYYKETWRSLVGLRQWVIVSKVLCSLLPVCDLIQTSLP